MSSKTKKYKSKTPYYKSSKGSDLRQELVTLCKNNKWKEYDILTNNIIDDYTNNKKDIFIHLENNFDTFSDTTKLCLLRFLTRAQEEAIAESMKYLHEIMLLTNKISRPYSSKSKSKSGGRRYIKRRKTIRRLRKYKKSKNSF